jgi:hypothetical protein
VTRRELACWTLLVLPLLGCDNSGEHAALTVRIATLEHELWKVGDQVTALKAAAPAADKSAAPSHAPSRPFRVQCLQPWVQHAPLGAALWSCRAPSPTPQGMYAQCNIVFQPQVEIETKNYFELALNAAPPYFEIKNVKDAHTTLNGADAFEATFDADPKPVPLKAMSALLPHGEGTFAITCVAPAASYDSYTKAFRQILDTFKFEGQSAAAAP